MMPGLKGKQTHTNFITYGYQQNNTLTEVSHCCNVYKTSKHNFKEDGDKEMNPQNIQERLPRCGK